MHGGNTYSLSENVLFLLKRASFLPMSLDARLYLGFCSMSARLHVRPSAATAGSSIRVHSSAMSLSSSARERERSAARGGGVSGERAHRGDRGKQREEDLTTPRSSLTTSLHRALLRQYLHVFFRRKGSGSADASAKARFRAAAQAPPPNS